MPLDPSTSARLTRYYEAEAAALGEIEVSNGARKVRAQDNLVEIRKAIRELKDEQRLEQAESRGFGGFAVANLGDSCGDLR